MRRFCVVQIQPRKQELVQIIWLPPGNMMYLYTMQIDQGSVFPEAIGNDKGYSLPGVCTIRRAL